MSHGIMSATARSRVALGLVLTMMLAGCSGYNTKSKGYMAEYRRGDCEGASSLVAEHVRKSKGESDELVWLLEAGTVARSAGRFKESNAYFERADAVMSSFEEKPELSLSAEAAATMTNQTALPYRGYPYDGIMLNTYKALNDLQLGDINAARVELNRAYVRQQQAVDKYARKIEQAQKEGKEKNVDSLKKDGRLNAQLSKEYADLDAPAQQAQYAAYKNYVNPLTELVQGLYYMSAGGDSSDHEHAVKSMERVAGMVSQNPYLAQDHELATDIANGKVCPPMTYVFFETGFAPHRETIRIDVPVFIAGKYSGGVDYVGAAFPRLDRDEHYRAPIRVAAGGSVLESRLVSSMDAIITQDFKNELPIIITKTLISSAAKAAAAYGINEGTKNNGWANIVARVGTGLYQVAMNKADERTWRTLPKYFYYCRFPTPADRQIEVLEGTSPSGPRLALAPGTINFVWVKSITPEQPLRISQFALPLAGDAAPAAPTPSTPAASPESPAPPTPSGENP